MEPTNDLEKARASLRSLVIRVAPDDAERFDLYWTFLEPRLPSILEAGGISPNRRTLGLGTRQFRFGSRAGDVVGGMILAGVGSWAEALKSKSTSREDVAKIADGYLHTFPEAQSQRTGIVDFICHMVSSGGESNPSGTNGSDQRDPLRLVQQLPKWDKLTPREREVVALLTKGKRPTEIAADLFISKKAASNYIGAATGKLGFNGATDFRVWLLQSW